MRYVTLASAALLASAEIAMAQAVAIEPDQEMVIREYVTTRQVETVEIPSDVSIEVGAMIPETVELHAIDSPDVDVQYRYVVVEDRTILVEPETREIVHIIE